MSDRFEDRKATFLSFKKLREQKASPQGTPVACKGCKKRFVKSEWKNNLYVCPSCGYHMPVNARLRIGMLVDEGSFEELFSEIEGTDPLNFPGYREKMSEVKAKRNMKEGFFCGRALIGGIPCAIGVLDSTFLMGSMGAATGEKITRLVETATEEGLMLVIVSASGGARMQEGMFSLMQMAKTSAAIGKHQEAGKLFVSILTHPTTGGVSASYANLGDIILAEPGALIGFAGPRVIQQTIGQKLPEGFQRSEFQLEHGFVDKIVERRDLREILIRIMRIHQV